jgi:hypothetical protein
VKHDELGQPVLHLLGKWKPDWLIDHHGSAPRMMSLTVCIAEQLCSITSSTLESRSQSNGNVLRSFNTVLAAVKSTRMLSQGTQRQPSVREI